MANTLLSSLSQKASSVQQALNIISPQAHARFDMFAFPSMLGLAAWAGQRSRLAGLLILANALGEGATGAITKWPRKGIFPLISFKAHVRAGQIEGPIFLALACFLPNIPPRERRAMIALGLTPIVLNTLSDISKSK
ncbi:hypothetical protein [Hymenobacter cavernae]|uniref:Uncharacterized protein n=1 Tax=Hymenobacter cavernae TaxID=2044852 RepID=A0ABQ1UWK0_9BACT|nr:hypothetical protein [Hymenobacter cavernae]GGF26897.1 hypothetical protein GCM10011383_43050 [Hymenobacter cavernae]